jgi:hypothetical protein
MSFATENAASDAASNAVTPSADNAKNKEACVKIAATPGKLRTNPKLIPFEMQFTAFGPGVVTKTAQNSANMVHASNVIQNTTLNKLVAR